MFKINEYQSNKIILFVKKKEAKMIKQKSKSIEVSKDEKCNIVFYIKSKVAFIRRKSKKFLKVYFSLPHSWVSIIILVFCFVCFWISVYYYKDNELMSSIYANIFAGLITGLVVSLISLIKGISLYITQNKIKWLNEIHKECIAFIKESKKLYFSKEGDFASEEEKYDKIYEVLCLGQNVNTSITQGQFNDVYPFNTYEYANKKLKYDAIEHSKINSSLRDKIINIDVSKTTNREYIELFKEMDDSIYMLNGTIIGKIKELEIKNKVINIT